jgi:uncharacterized protein involved in response to NO
MISTSRFFYNSLRFSPIIFIVAAFLTALFFPAGEVVLREGIIAGKKEALEIVVAAAILVALNFALSIFLQRREKLLSAALEAANFILSAGTLIAVASRFYF